MGDRLYLGGRRGREQGDDADDERSMGGKIRWGGWTTLAQSMMEVPCRDWTTAFRGRTRPHESMQHREYFLRRRWVSEVYSGQV